MLNEISDKDEDSLIIYRVHSAHLLGKRLESKVTRKGVITGEQYS